MVAPTAPKWVRVNKRNPCPICDKPDWCLISQDGKVAICARIESDRPAGNKGAGWLHTLDNSMSLPPPKPSRPASTQTLKVAPDELDKVYRALLGELLLSETHRVHLQRRGLSGSELHTLGYKTLPANGRCELVTRLQAKGVRLAGVPGFYIESGYWHLAGPVGIANSRERH